MAGCQGGSSVEPGASAVTHSADNLSEGQALDVCATLDTPENAQLALVACNRAIGSNAFKGDVLASVYFNRGLSYLDLAESNAAISDFKKAIEIKPDHINAIMALAWEFDLTDQNELAAQYFSDAIDITPENAEAHCGRGWMYAKEAEYAKALAILRQSMELESNACAASTIGWVLAKEGQLIEAIAAFELAIQIDPAHRFSWAELAWARYDMEQYSEAEKAASEAVRIDPDHSFSLIALGWAQREQEKLDRALASFSRAVEITPQDPFAHYGKGYVLDDLGRFSEALEAYNQAIMFGGVEASHYNARGLLLRRLGRLEEAEADLKKTSELSPKSAVARYNYAEILAQLDKIDEAIEMFDSAVVLERKSTLIDEFINVLKKKHYQDEAKEIEERMRDTDA